MENSLLHDISKCNTISSAKEILRNHTKFSSTHRVCRREKVRGLEQSLVAHYTPQVITKRTLH